MRDTRQVSDKKVFVEWFVLFCFVFLKGKGLQTTYWVVRNDEAVAGITVSENTNQNGIQTKPISGSTDTWCHLMLFRLHKLWDGLHKYFIFSQSVCCFFKCLILVCPSSLFRYLFQVIEDSRKLIYSVW